MYFRVFYCVIKITNNVFKQFLETVSAAEENPILQSNSRELHALGVHDER